LILKENGEHLLFCVTGNGYNVEAVPSDDMNKLQASGNLVLYLSHDEIRLAQTGTLAMIAIWPLSSLRRYSSENGVFMIEAGRRSPRGQGLYEFKTVHDSELFDRVYALIKLAATAPQNTQTQSNKELSEALMDDVPAATSFGFDIDNRPPAPLPLISLHPPPLPPKDNTLDDVDSGGIRLTYDSVMKAAVQQHRQASLMKVSEFIFICIENCMQFLSVS